MEAGSPRDLLARMIGWNRLTVLGSKAILDGTAPPYHSDFASGYARVNAELIRGESSQDKAQLLTALEKTKSELAAYFQSLPPDVWNVDHGIRHPDCGPATVRRCLEELTRDYLDVTDELTIWLETASKG
jgi:hypothetical protein